MTQPAQPILVDLIEGGFRRTDAVAAVRSSKIAEALLEICPGEFGHTARGATILNSLVDGFDLGLAAAAQLEGMIRTELGGAPGSFSVPTLAPEHHQIVAAFQLIVTADHIGRGLADCCASPAVEGALELEGLDELLQEGDANTLATRVARLSRAYWGTQMGQAGQSNSEADEFVGTTLAAFFMLLRRAVNQLAHSGRLLPLLKSLEVRSITVAGHPYQGLEQEVSTDTPVGLLPVMPEDIVGNVDYIEAGLRLAKDVAGYDFEAQKNPKKLNPILFGLGSPGCGKTITGHAVGNAFLAYCKERDIPARFLVVRRSDWASSYQNASASNLIRLFREEVAAFPGVCGVYWPDIDTALASRGSSNLRTGEKQNLGAVFGIFDGTLLPKNGKWFLICDANTMHMDEAAISRIAQNPFTVEGPSTPEHYTRLMRDIMLKDVKPFIPDSDEAWVNIGKAACTHALSGRNIEAVARNIRTEIQDFEYPDRYFKASTEERASLIAELSKAVDETFILDALASMVEFKQEADRRAEADQFEQEVEQIVRQLNAGRAAMERAGGGTGEGQNVEPV